jgi:hypothetical protein
VGRHVLDPVAAKIDGTAVAQTRDILFNGSQGHVLYSYEVPDVWSAVMTSVVMFRLPEFAALWRDSIT